MAEFLSFFERRKRGRQEQNRPLSHPTVRVPRATLEIGVGAHAPAYYDAGVPILSD